MRILVGVALLYATTGTVLAQQIPDLERPSERDTASTTIPITAPGSTEVMGAEGAATSTVAPPVSLEHPIDPATYVCGPGDVFELNFWGKQNFRLRFAADLEGRSFISKVGYVDVAGKTLNAVRTQVTKKVRANYPGLQFDLTLVSPRSFLVHVVENVKQPGTHSAQPVERVSAVITRAGGITNGSRRKITVTRKNGAVVTADLLLYELTGDVAHNPLVLDGDVIRVPFADVEVNIAGAVRRPGNYELVSTKDLAELLHLAGGLTPAAARSLPIRVIRRDEAQKATTHELPYGGGGALPNMALRADDSVIVRGADELQRSVLLIGAVTGAESLDAAATSKRLPYVEGDTALSLLDRAGGIRAPGDLSRSYVARAGKDGKLDMIPVDLDALIVRRDFTADVDIAIGDTLVVPPMRHSILVEGAVQRAGLYTYTPRFTINENVALAGGRTRTARDLDEVKLVEPSGATRSYKAGMRLSPGDAILVPERNFSRPEVAQIVIATAGVVLSAVAITLAATR